MPNGGTWTARRQIFTDEWGVVKITVVYEIQAGGKVWTQTEEQFGFDGPTSVTKGNVVEQPPHNGSKDKAAPLLKDQERSLDEQELADVVASLPKEMEIHASNRVQVNSTCPTDSDPTTPVSTTVADLVAATDDLVALNIKASDPDDFSDQATAGSLNEEPPPQWKSTLEENQPSENAAPSADKTEENPKKEEPLTCADEPVEENQPNGDPSAYVEDPRPESPAESDSPREAAVDTESDKPPVPPIGAPVDLPRGAGWKAERIIETTGDVRTMTTNYVITHHGKQWTQKETIVGNASPTIEKSEVRDAPPEDVLPPPPPIGPPRDLPAGASWKANRELRKNERGVLQMTTTYEITHAGKMYEQKETQHGDVEPIVEKGEVTECPLEDTANRKPIGDPIDLPPGAGWKAKRTTLNDENGVTKTETTYVITVLDTQSRLRSEYTQVEVQIGDGDVTITKTDPNPTGY